MLLLLPAQSGVLELGSLGAAAPAAGGGQCWCWTGLGSWLVRCRLVGVTGAPLAAAAVAPEQASSQTS
eukprot:1141271-Pelagomonas_calceolata.AAC.5